MMFRRGHEVYHLGTEGSEPECTEHISVTPKSLWDTLYQHPGVNFYNLETEGKYKPYHDLYAAQARAEILKRCRRPYEAIVCATWGGAQRIAVENVPQFVVESGVGYRHTWAQYKVFESYAWMHTLYGEQCRFQGDGWYDVVIPNAFDPDMFQFRDRAEKDDFFLFMGRLEDDKGVAIAIDIAKRVGRRLVMVGQGNPGPFLAGNSHVEYLPPVGVEGRKELMSRARAFICPTRYIEPFGGVAVEAQLSGTPVITTDWGAFPETVCHGYTGYRCRTMEQFEWAARNVDSIDPAACRAWAELNFSTDRVALMYEEYFASLLALVCEGWYQPNSNRTQLDWLRKVYPVSRPVDREQRLEMPELKMASPWEEAHDWESNWWGLGWNEKWDQEIDKQHTYARLMGLPPDLWLRSPTDPSNVRVLDVGCGPVSMLLRANLGAPPAEPVLRSVGVDPLRVSEETKRRYAAQGVEFLNIKAEDINEAAPLFEGGFDEIWLYNCLQHVDVPPLVLEKIKRVARKTVRIFEWLNLPPCPGHPHTLTESLFTSAFLGWKRVIWNTGCLHGFGGTVTNEYLAAWVERP
jgi:glycosyltransferase involved in cell wall biosynthesis/SAM-dependent methyltransferase